jgi:hypothetical protein
MMKIMSKGRAKDLTQIQLSRDAKRPRIDNEPITRIK